MVGSRGVRAGTEGRGKKRGGIHTGLIIFFVFLFFVVW